MTPDYSLLFLIGYRGTGKSSVGKLLAQHIGWTFVDADEELERRYGRSISALVAEKGEADFRDKEESVLASLCEADKQVIATGGGVVLRESSRTRLRAHGSVVWLTTSAETIWRRLQSDPTTAERRPALGAGGKQEIEECLHQRDALYRSCADLTISTESLSPDDVANLVLKLLCSAADSPKQD